MSSSRSSFGFFFFWIEIFKQKLYKKEKNEQKFKQPYFTPLHFIFLLSKTIIYQHKRVSNYELATIFCYIYKNKGVYDSIKHLTA